MKKNHDQGKKTRQISRLNFKQKTQAIIFKLEIVKKMLSMLIMIDAVCNEGFTTKN